MAEDDEPPHCIDARYSDIADKLKRAQTECDQNQKLRQMPNLISNDEE